MATSFPAAATKSNFDQSTDDPKQARSELAQLVDNFNTLLTALGSSSRLNLGKGITTETKSAGVNDLLQVNLSATGGLFTNASDAVALKLDTLTAIASLATDDLLTAHDISAGTTGRVTVQQVLALLGSGVPTGTIIAYGSTTPPAEWLACVGTAVSRSTYAALFGVVGTTYGAGDGASTFNLPDLRGRIAMGYGQGVGLSNRTIGQQVGAETHQLSTTEMPSHTHSYSALTGAYSSGYVAGGAGQGESGQQLASTATGGAGSGAAHNNVQPSLVVNFLIKT